MKSSKVRQTRPHPEEQSLKSNTKTAGATIKVGEANFGPRSRREDGQGRLPVRGQPLPASGLNRVPRQIEIPVIRKASRSQCSPVTITEIASIPNSSATSLSQQDEDGSNNKNRRSSHCLVRCRSSASSRTSLMIPGGGGQSLEPFPDTESVFSDGTNVSDNVTMIVPQNQASYAVTSNDPCGGHRTMSSHNHHPQGQGGWKILPVLVQTLSQLTSSRYCTWKSLPYVIVALFFFFFFFPIKTIFTVLAFGYISAQFLGTPSSKKISRRTVKWTIADFSEEIRNGFLTCPPFLDKSGQWRLVVSQNMAMDGVQTTLGLLATDIPSRVEVVLAKMSFSCTNSWGVELSPGMNRVKLQHRFERSGDLGSTSPIMFSNRLLGAEDTVNIVCRVDFQTVTIGYWKLIKRWLGVVPSVRSNTVRLEVGNIRQETLVYKDSTPAKNMIPLTRFVQNLDTKTFAWEIPNFAMVLKNKEIWGVCSPQFFVKSEDFCSVWRMKLIEVSGVFRVHVQLRGLPNTVQKVKLFYLLQLVDNFGDSTIPENSVSRVKYPDHLNLWDTSRHILYRRETLLSRYLGMDGSLTLRLSLQVQSNNIPLMEADSDEWINY